MKHTFTLLLVMSFFAECINAQVIADFENTDTSPDLLAPAEHGVVDNPYKTDLNLSDKVAYYKKPAQDWKSIKLVFPQAIHIANNNRLSFNVHCSTVGRVHVKLHNSNGVFFESWAHKYNAMPESGKWVELELDLTDVTNEDFIRIQVAAGVNNLEEAEVYLDNFRLERHIRKTSLYYAVEAGNAFIDSMVEGTDTGEFPAGSVDAISQALATANLFLDNQDSLTDKEIEEAANDLHDAIINVEAMATTLPNNLIDDKVSHQTVVLYKNLKTIASSKRQLFGMHAATAYGINADGSEWTDDGTASKSDLKEVTGSHGAITSFDANMLVTKTFDEMADYRNRIVTNYAEGGVTTICWHIRDPKYSKFSWEDVASAGAYNVVASILEEGEYHEWYKDQLYRLAFFLKGFRGTNGESIPIIFRPFHEHNGGWFWWGKDRCSTSEYNKLWQFTVDHLRNSLNVHNLIYALSPGAGARNIPNKQDYFTIYPGDGYIDIFGIDFYFESSANDTSYLARKLTHIVELAQERGKLAALTETGYRGGLKSATWFTQNLLPAIHDNELSKQIAYCATWRNANTDHFFVPYPGHEGVPDFLEFYDDPSILFLNDMPDVYNSLLTPPPPPGPYPDPLSEALDTSLGFATGGSADWFAQTMTSYYDGDAAQSGDISHSQESWMQTTVSGKGTVKFYWKVSSEEDFDFLEFYIDGSLQEKISGSVNWEQQTYTISTSGPHTLEWRYVKDGSGASGSDCGWVDKVEWVTN